ncbi:MAG TPA: hypothetical protein VFQ44_15440 [Streptosporangiaceae bacterium]|nr:hypothetical protein [Streptosporangiaceae bacterium]
MSGIADQLPALAGVVIGATASYLIGAATDRARWMRGQSARWDDRRSEAYADYAHAVKAVYVQCMRIAGSRGLAPGPGVADLDAALAEMVRLAGERTARWELVLLLGDPETIAAGRTWHRRVWELEQHARGERNDPDDFAALRAGFNSDRTRFYAAARRDLGIRSGEIPAAEQWELDPSGRARPDTAAPQQNQPE